jgi:hypothetical protein
MTARLIRITTALGVATVAAVAAVISYRHAYELVSTHGETGHEAPAARQRHRRQLRHRTGCRPRWPQFRPQLAEQDPGEGPVVRTAAPLAVRLRRQTLWSAAGASGQHLAPRQSALRRSAWLYGAPGRPGRRISVPVSG